MRHNPHALLSKPEHFMRFVTTGQLPNVHESEETPLRRLIAAIPVTYWSCFRAVRLSPELGFNSSACFSNLHQVMHYIGHNQTVMNNQRLPYQSYINRKARKVTLDSLLAHCDCNLNDKQIERLKSRLGRRFR